MYVSRIHRHQSRVMPICLPTHLPIYLSTYLSTYPPTYLRAPMYVSCIHRHQLIIMPMRVPGLPIGDCAGSSNNLVPRGTKLSAIDVTARAIFECVYLVQDCANLRPESNVPIHPQPHRSLADYFSISMQFFPQVAPHFFGQHDSPSNLAESRYPHAHLSTYPSTTMKWDRKLKKNHRNGNMNSVPNVAISYISDCIQSYISDYIQP